MSDHLLDLGGERHDPRPGHPGPLVVPAHAARERAQYHALQFARWAQCLEVTRDPLARAAVARRAQDHLAMCEEWR